MEQQGKSVNVEELSTEQLLELKCENLEQFYRMQSSLTVINLELERRKQVKDKEPPDKESDDG